MKSSEIFEGENSGLMKAFKGAMTNQPNKYDDVRGEFYDRFVEMSPLYGRDLHNQPPLYETKFDDINEMIDFIIQALEKQEREIRREKNKCISEFCNEEALYCAECYRAE